MKIICIGRNYLEHARELKNPVPQKPVFFLKPSTALVNGNCTFKIPSFSNEIHYETELVFRMSKKGSRVLENQAIDCIDGIGIGLDFTARDLQQAAKEKGLPWEIAKAFDNSAPISEEMLPVSYFEDLQNIEFSLLKNGEKVQEGNSADMIFSIQRIIAYVSEFITLEPGDLVFTGTPEGVGRVAPGDILEAFIGRRKMLVCSIE